MRCINVQYIVSLYIYIHFMKLYDADTYTSQLFVYKFR